MLASNLFTVFGDGAHLTLRRALLLAAVAAPAATFARETALREVMDMRVAFAAGAPNKPFVLLASLQGCPFCEFVRRSYLVPMNKEGQVNAWQLSIDRNAPVIGFSGNSFAARTRATALGVRTTPTVLFLGATGKPLAEPIVGVVSSEFYGAVLDERLKAAIRASA